MHYSWRGLSIDIARSFFGPPVLTRLIDRMAELGLNRLHLHLTDDQGWRLEIPGWPDLTRVSGATASAGGSGGYLTVRDYATLVEYAESRGIVVVPEIDLPGHVNAALHACPALNPGGVAPEAYDGDDVGFSYLRPDAATQVFLHDVLTAVASMTPGPWVHIGGDECPLLGRDAYNEIVRMAVNTVVAAGKSPVAWQEAAVANLGSALTLQYWRTGPATDAGSLAALLAQVDAGADVILSPASHTYFDHKYEPSDTFGQDWAGTLSVDQARAWEPDATIPGLDPARILGVEAAIWTEFIHTEADLDRMLLPRLEAFAEVACQ